MSKNEFFYIGRGFIQDHRGPHKTKKKLEKRAENGPKTGLGTGTGMNRPGYEPNRTEPEAPCCVWSPSILLRLAQGQPRRQSQGF